MSGLNPSLRVAEAGNSSDAFEAAVIRKVSLRLIPFLFLLYVINLIDRTNIGIARLQMVDELHLMDEQAYGQGAAIFYIGYLFFEVPSNLILARMGARAWMSRIMISWGIVTACMMFVNGPGSFYFLRILLGIAEAGFFPGMILYLSYWFPTRVRAKAVSRFMTAGVVASIIGNPISASILEYMHGLGTLAGWQWVFLLEGLPAVILGVVTLYYLTDRPELATWLTPDERDWLVQQMAGEEQRRHQRHGLTLLRSLADVRVWILIGVYFTVAMGDNGYGFYLGKLLKDNFPTWNKAEIGFLAAVPGIFTIVAMLLVGAHSDRTGERRWHVAGPAFLAALGWTMAALSQSPWFFLFALTVTLIGMKSMLPTFWTLPSSFLTGTAAAGGIALINSVGNLGGYFGPDVLGRVGQAEGSFGTAMFILSGALAVGGVLVLFLRHDRALETGDGTTETQRRREEKTEKPIGERIQEAT